MRSGNDRGSYLIQGDLSSRLVACTPRDENEDASPNLSFPTFLIGNPVSLLFPQPAGIKTLDSCFRRNDNPGVVGYFHTKTTGTCLSVPVRPVPAESYCTDKRIREASVE